LTNDERIKDPLVRPFLKWAGGKRQLLPEIRARLPDNIHSLKYYEPFVGAGALFFDLQPKRAVINDSNRELILVYNVIKNNIDELIEALKNHTAQNNENYYYLIREQDRDRKTYAALTETEKAARVIYLNKTCYNGLYRVNSRGLFNVPYGRYTNPAICDESGLRAVSGYLNNEGSDINIMEGDFTAATENAREDSFVYFDPPYHSPANNNFTGYQAGGFGEEEQKRLRDVFITCTDAGALCLLSNSDTPLIRELYNNEKFEIITLRAKRTINSDASGRGKTSEVLIKNWKG